MIGPNEIVQGEKLLTVAKAARLVGAPASTLRFYEREGLVSPTGKSRAGYRLYDADAIARLRFVRAAQGIGLPLRDILTVVGMNARTSRAQMKGLLETRLGEVEQKLAHLTTVRNALTGALARCRRSGDCCRVLVSLSVGASTPAKGETTHEKVHVPERRGNGRRRRGDADGGLPGQRAVDQRGR